MWLDDLQEAIAAQGFVDSAEAVVIGPPEDDESLPDLCIGLVDREGPADVTYGAVYGRPNLTIVVRSDVYGAPAAHDVAMSLFLWLTSQANVTLGSTRFLYFEPMAWPGRLRLDSKKRTDITAEVGVWLDEAGGVVPSTP